MAAHTPEGQLQTLTSEHTDTLFRPERSARNVRGRGSAGGGRGKGEPYATHAALAAHAPLCHQDPPLNKHKDVAPSVAAVADCDEGKKMCVSPHHSPHPRHAAAAAAAAALHTHTHKQHHEMLRGIQMETNEERVVRGSGGGVSRSGLAGGEVGAAAVGGGSCSASWRGEDRVYIGWGTKRRQGGGGGDAVGAGVAGGAHAETFGMSCVREREIESDTEMGGCVGDVSWEERLRPGPNAPLIDLLRYSLAHTQVK